MAQRGEAGLALLTPVDVRGVAVDGFPIDQRAQDFIVNVTH